MKTISAIIKSFLIVILLSGVADAAPSKWEIDPAHSGIYFDIRHIFSTIRGRFNDFSGDIMIDEENPSSSTISFEVKIDSINTNIDQRDTHLKSPDFFNAGQYPVMKFKSGSVEHVNDNNYILSGDLTIKDVTRELRIPFKYLGKRDNPMKPGTFVAGFECSFPINRLEYHVGDGGFYKKGLVDKDVFITITLELIRDK